MSKTIKPVIPVITNSRERSALRDKLEEYRGCLEQRGEDREFDRYKAFILETVLETRFGETLLVAVAADYGAKHGTHRFDPEKFQGAWRVIEDYASTGGRHVHGGTGIHRVIRPLRTSMAD